VRDLADLAAPAFRRIAIANPEHAPYGRAAREALLAAGLWSDLEPRIVIAENARQTVQYLDARAVDAAIGALSLMREGEHAWVSVPEHLYRPLRQTVAVVADRPHEERAREFARFVLGPRGREILARHRFVLPDTPRRP
jgi:molybdate transport system substrate-binding protein